MSVDATTVRRIAHLARIAVTDDKVPHLQGELNAILAFVEQLSEVDVKGVEPMTSVAPMRHETLAEPGDDDITLAAVDREDIVGWSPADRPTRSISGPRRTRSGPATWTLTAGGPGRTPAAGSTDRPVGPGAVEGRYPTPAPHQHR